MRTDDDVPDLHPDVGLLRCADCRRWLVGPMTAARLDAGVIDDLDALAYPRVAGHVPSKVVDEKGNELGKVPRPYCHGCIELPDYPAKGGSYGPSDDASPRFEDAVKVVEDGV